MWVIYIYIYIYINIEGAQRNKIKIRRHRRQCTLCVIEYCVIAQCEKADKVLKLTYSNLGLTNF